MALAARGWTRVESGGDAAVSAFGRVAEHDTLETFYTGFGGGWRWREFGDGFATTTVEKTPVGTLVLDIFDSTSKKLIWRGTASEVLSDKPEKNEMKVEKALTEMFKHFPPPPKS